MYKLLSKKIVVYLIQNQSIDREKKELFEYCFEVFLSTFINIGIIISISILIKAFLPSFLFLLSFVSCRMCFGGFHAKTHLTCFLATVINYIIFILLLKSFIVINSFFVFLILNLLSIMLVHFFAPIENENNPLSAIHAKKLKHISYVVSYGIFFICIGLFLLKFIPKYFTYSLSIGLLSAAFAMLLGKLEIHFKERRG